MNNIVLTILAAGAFTALTLPVIAQSKQPFEPYEIPVPGGSPLTYTIIDARRVGKSQFDVITRSTGETSGDLYVRQLIDCTQKRFQIRAESDTLEGLKTKTVSRDWLQVRPSLRTYAAVFKGACERLILLKL
ncbi:hypothetical protein ILT44_29395 [Microvirga sp. BT689]|uniref:hypothetical protein n=1 Tax=Microvirga arvi TaxID=2778731 RepID=UPI00194EEB22|nr:hypothetical protein [Microvirga arvi]MBM6584313.1 hypothetical protein [Microvirga arvi]